MLRMDPRQRGRLVEIIRTLEDRITEARLNGWLGEVQGLQTSRDAAAKKLVTLDRNITQIRHGATEPTTLGMPLGRVKGVAEQESVRSSRRHWIRSRHPPCRFILVTADPFH